ncbi:MAG TPA: hypothetical protein VJ436_01430, partial [Anaerolineales bacterium]|nr:hypothetical protein [Anaerolineales bacterium]
RGERRALDSVEVLTPGGGWTPGPPLPVGLHGVPAVGLGQRLFVLGGSDRAGGIQNAGRVLSLSVDTLDNPSARRPVGCGALTGGGRCV